MGGDVSVDSELVVRSLCLHRGECLYMFVRVCVCTVFLEKKDQQETRIDS